MSLSAAGQLFTHFFQSGAETLLETQDSKTQDKNRDFMGGLRGLIMSRM